MKICAKCNGVFTTTPMIDIGFLEKFICDKCLKAEAMSNGYVELKELREKCAEWEKAFDSIYPGQLLTVKQDGTSHKLYPKDIDPRKVKKSKQKRFDWEMGV